MKEIQLCLLLILFPIKSTLTAPVSDLLLLQQYKVENDFDEERAYKHHSRRHLSQPLRITNENVDTFVVGILKAENETLVSTLSSSDITSATTTEFDDNALENQFLNPNDSTSDSSSPNDFLIIEVSSTTVGSPPIHSPLVQENTTERVSLGHKCNSTSKCMGNHVDCLHGVCSCMTGYEDHQNVCLESGGFARLREACNDTNICMGQFTICRVGTCTCRDGYYSNYDKYDSCIERSVTHTDVSTKTDPTMIGVVIGLALMSVTLCVVMRLFAKARFRENRTIFNTANPRLMNVTLKKGSKHGGGNRGRRGSQISVQSGEYEESAQTGGNDKGASDTPTATKEPSSTEPASTAPA